jgi:putative flavoprotein involved in K+ transport
MRNKAVEQWIKQFNTSFASVKTIDLDCLFQEKFFWRDILCISWSLNTFETHQEVLEALKQNKVVLPLRIEGYYDLKGDGEVVECFVDLSSGIGRGKGYVRLKRGKAWTLLTTLEELHGHEEKRGDQRILGTRHGAHKNRQIWHEEKKAEEQALGYSEQPYCLVVGGGQAGIMLATRLKKLGVSTIILEKNKRAGDSWRNRYRFLTLHDPVWYDHFPYISFPDDWPIFTPKNKMGDWLEMYTKVMDLNYWTESKCTKATFDEAKEEWEVELLRKGEKLILRPTQLVFTTGAYGPPKEIPIKGKKKFKGQIFHSSEYQDGRDFKGKHCVVVGAATSAHDISQDLWECGAKSITMVQRTPSIIIKSETLLEYGFGELYSEQALKNGITTEKADLLFASTPFKLLPDQHREVYQQMYEQDKEFYDQLGASGFQFDFGEDSSGLLMRALRTASGYYIDVGASELIIQKKVKLKTGATPERVDEKFLYFDDGSKLAADVIFFAIGYHSMDKVIEKLISKKTAEKVGRFWGIGSGIKGDPGPWEGELRNLWKPTKQLNLWFHGGNLHLSRFYSKYVALQIKGRMEQVKMRPVMPK